LALFDTVSIVKLEYLDRDSCFWSQGPDHGIFKPKVIVPGLRAGIEERRQHTGFGIKRANVRAFVPVTAQTSERHVLRSCLAVVLQRDDVIGFVPVGRRFRQAAILATSVRSLVQRQAGAIQLECQLALAARRLRS